MERDAGCAGCGRPRYWRIGKIAEVHDGNSTEVIGALNPALCTGCGYTAESDQMNCICPDTRVTA